ncbi:hypothetical protein MJL27_25580, partial [Salmonella enterica subsp. enterica serovar Anatum]|nr:hypothetical protein [Salmonella enterica subsp. enterica serovar Anatum]
QGSAKYLDMAQQYQHLGPLYEVPEGLRNKARHNEPYYPPVEPTGRAGSFDIGLSGCTGSKDKTTKISTVFVGNQVTSNGNLGNTGSAKNV